MKTTNIYTLTDPRTNEIRYVGKANNVTQRYLAHLNRARKHQIHKLNWINSLRKDGLKPILQIIDVVPIEEWIFWETYWISQIKTWGFNLINYTQGGDGCTFGNQTSFKKGNITWNTGTAKLLVCKNCNKEFSSKNTNGAFSYRMFCSEECKKHQYSPHEGCFNKNHIPWNKSKFGYALTGAKTAKPVLQYDLEGNFIREFKSAKEAGLLLNCTYLNIQHVCNGKNKTAKNYKWKYK